MKNNSRFTLVLETSIFNTSLNQHILTKYNIKKGQENFLVFFCCKAAADLLSLWVK
jgi:hypothetical protein